jgi:hypothetical protein
MYAATPRLLCLEYYMAAGRGWDYVSRCNVSRELYRDGICPIAGYEAPDDPCSRDVCRRRPPSLRDLGMRTVHSFVFNIDMFELTREVTLPQYHYADSSYSVDTLRLLPPDYHQTTDDCRFDCCEMHKFHSYCLQSGSSSSHMSIYHMFETSEDAIDSQMTHRRRFFCFACFNPVFSPETCRLHENI